jgi:hypothetical protein
MQRLPNATILTLAVLLAVPTLSVHAQSAWGPQVRPNNTYMRPPVLSPYLNLLPIRPAGVNYFLNVVPEIDRRAQFNQINQQLFDLQRLQAQPQQPVEDPLLPPLESTGHPVGFMNFAPYFNFSGAGPAASTQQFFRPPPSRGSRGGQ